MTVADFFTVAGLALLSPHIPARTALLSGLGALLVAASLRLVA